MAVIGKIEVGSVVRLKSGGPAMTVTRRENACIADTVMCAWIDNVCDRPIVCRDHFPVACLSLVENLKSPF